MLGNLETIGLSAVAVAAMGIGAAIGGPATTIGTAVTFSWRLSRTLPFVVEIVANAVT